MNNFEQRFSETEQKLVDLHNENFQKLSDEFQMKVEQLRNFYLDHVANNNSQFKEYVQRVIDETIRMERKQDERDAIMKAEYDKMIKANLVIAASNLVAQGFDPFTAMKKVKAMMTY